MKRARTWSRHSWGGTGLGDVQATAIFPNLAPVVPGHPAQEQKARDCQEIPASLLLGHDAAREVIHRIGGTLAKFGEMVFDNKDL
jgi:hypothetical protein